MRNVSAHQSTQPDGAQQTGLREIAWVFLKLGTIAFGGPAAHIGMMEDEIVRRKKWVTREEFLDLLGAANLIPGPNSTEMAIHIGHRKGGWPGLLVAGSCFILPAGLIVMLLAGGYVRYGALPAISGILYGVKPVIIAVVLQALWNLGRTAVKSRAVAVIGAAGVAATLAGVNELLVLLAGGFLAVLGAGFVPRKKGGTGAGIISIVSGAPLAGVVQSGAAASAASVGLWPLFLFFLKVGSVLYGSGYVLLAFLRADLVQHLHWLTESQLLDAVAVGQVTPGPVFTTATFVGYVLGGPAGGVVATIGIFLPAFIFVALSGPLIPLVRRSASARAFLDGVNVASLALMLVVTFQLARAAVVDLPTAVLAGVSVVLLLRFRVNSTWLVLVGATAGFALRGIFLIVPH